MERNAYCLRRRILPEEPDYVRLEFDPIPCPGRKRKELLNEIEKPKREFSARLDNFLRDMAVRSSVHLIQFFMDENPTTYLATKYFTAGLCYTDDVRHRIINKTRGVPVYVYMCHPSEKHLYVSKCDCKLALVSKLRIVRDFIQHKVLGSFVVPSGTVYFFYTVSHTLLTVEDIGRSIEDSDPNAASYQDHGSSRFQAPSGSARYEPSPFAVVQPPWPLASPATNGREITADTEPWTDPSAFVEVEMNSVAGSDAREIKVEPQESSRSTEDDAEQSSVGAANRPDQEGSGPLDPPSTDAGECRESQQDHVDDPEDDDAEPTDLERSFRDLEKQIRNRERQTGERTKNLKRELRDKDLELQALRQSLEQSRESQRETESQLNDLRDAVKRKDEDVRSLQARERELLAAQQRLEADLRAVRRELEAGSETFRKECDVYREKSEELTRRVEELTAHCEKLREQQSHADQENCKMSEKLSVVEAILQNIVHTSSES